MKTLFAFAMVTVILCLILLGSCSKKESLSSSQAMNAVFTDQAKSYFNKLVQESVPGTAANPRFTTTRFLSWDNAYFIPFKSSEALVVPVSYAKEYYLHTSFGGLKKYYGLSTVTNMLFYKDSLQQFHGELLTSLPDSSFAFNALGYFSGLMLVDSWSGDNLAAYRIANNVAAKCIPAGQAKQTSDKVTESTARTTTGGVICYQIEGYNYSPDDPNGGYYWTQPLPCMEPVFDYDYNGYGGATGGVGFAKVPNPVRSAITVGPVDPRATIGRPTVSNVEVFSPTNPIPDITTYLKCYDNIGSADYQYNISICVDQPVPGAREPWKLVPSNVTSLTNPVDVGHTFLILTETHGGITTSRSVGFYPGSAVIPRYPTAQGVLNNDQNHGYDISVQINVNSVQFTQVLNYVSLGNNPGFTYDLNYNNCTTFALQALRSGGINLPATVGTWGIDGHGNNPGDLGEDLRSMPLSSNMTRSTSGAPHLNVGFCN